MTTRVYAVDSVTMALQKSNPPNLIITATGRANGPLWTCPQLVARASVPKDGVQGFNFVAVPPQVGTITVQPLIKTIANTVLPEIDIANFWGVGKPLMGVRCHAQSNVKTTLFDAPMGMQPVTEILPDGSALSFATDIHPLFRPVDINMMIAVRNLDLGSHEVVSEHADLILLRLKDGSMPCDGPWPATDIDLFARWIAQGKKP